jgi:TolA-binding protein
MDNSRNLIRSSIVSLIVVSFGLFMLCMSSAPSVDTNNSILQGGGGLDSDSDLLSLLNEAGGEMDLGDASELFSDGDNATSESTNEFDLSDDEFAVNDDDLTALMSEAGDDWTSEQPDAITENESMDELYQLLGSGEDAKYSESLPLDEPMELAVTEFGESESNMQQTDVLMSDNNQAVNSLNDQIYSLEQVLAKRTSEKEDLQSELNRFDLQLAEMESQFSYSKELNRSITPASYSKAQPSRTSRDLENEMGSFTNNAVHDYEIVYKEARRFFQEHRYRQAAHRFRQLLQVSQGHSLADNCQYWIGECYFAQGKYYQAIAEFTKVGAYDAADKKDDAQIMLGLAFIKLGEVQHAQSELDWLVSAFASSEYVSRAYRYLRQL